MGNPTSVPHEHDAAVVKYDRPDAADWLAAPAIMFFIGTLLLVSAIVGG